MLSKKHVLSMLDDPAPRFTQVAPKTSQDGPKVGQDAEGLLLHDGQGLPEANKALGLECTKPQNPQGRSASLRHSILVQLPKGPVSKNGKAPSDSSWMGSREGPHEAR